MKTRGWSFCLDRAVVTHLPPSCTPNFIQCITSGPNSLIRCPGRRFIVANHSIVLWTDFLGIVWNGSIPGMNHHREDRFYMFVHKYDHALRSQEQDRWAVWSLLYWKNSWYTNPPLMIGHIIDIGFIWGSCRFEREPPQSASVEARFLFTTGV